LGCAKTKPAKGPPPQLPPDSTNVTVTPVVPITGKVVVVNRNGNFVILTLAPGIYPPTGTLVYTYRKGRKTAELRVTGPQNDENTAADILSGEPLKGDTISDE
jgi:hypothetical protein